jgi:hypothetical protein
MIHRLLPALAVIAVIAPAAMALLLPYPGTGMATEAGIEAGIDLEEKQRRLFHQDTGDFQTTLKITGYSVFGEGRAGDSWKFRLEYLVQDWRLDGPESLPRIDATVTHFKPRVEYEDGGLKVRGTLLVTEVKEGDSYYAQSDPGAENTFLMPGVDITVTRKELRFLAGGWRELDLYAYPDNTYTPMLYQTVYVGMRYVESERLEYGGKLSLTTREFPDDLPQKRIETEGFYLIRDPLGPTEKSHWRELSFKLAHWQYDIDNEDTLFLSMKNRFRFQSGPVSHDLQHRLTLTDVYVVYEENPGLPGSMVEIDKKGFDLQQRVDYTAWGRVRESNLYWRAGARLDHSLDRQVYLEWRIKGGLSLVF